MVFGLELRLGAHKRVLVISCNAVWLCGAVVGGELLLTEGAAELGSPGPVCLGGVGPPWRDGSPCVAFSATSLSWFHSICSFAAFSKDLPVEGS